MECLRCSAIAFITMIICSSSSVVVDGLIKLPENLKFPAVLVFGDSIVDQGNNNNINTVAKCNFPPYGKDLNGGVPTGRFSNARTPADLIASELGVTDIIPAYLASNVHDKNFIKGVSFASGGTGYDPQTTEIVSSISLPDQIELLKEYLEKVKGIVGEEGKNDILANALFMVIAGSNDLVNTYFALPFTRLQYSLESYTNLMVNSAANVAQELYRVGARRIGVFGVPPIGCVPSQRTLAGGLTRECSEEYNNGARLFNSKLSSKLQSLGTKLPQSRVVYMDAYQPVIEIIQNPSKYGIEVVNKGCCGTGNIEVTYLCNKFTPTCWNDTKYLFWDSFHPTEKGYHILISTVIGKYIKMFS